MVVKEPSLKNLTDVKYGRPPENSNVSLQDLTRPHIDSFNYVIKEGLSLAAKAIPPEEFALPNGDKISIYIPDASIMKPAVPKSNTFAFNPLVYPAECRQGKKSYAGKMSIRLCWKLDGELRGSEDIQIGDVPVMVRSAICNTYGMKPTELISVGEEAEEMGGYFIINGHEKILRMLIMPRRNYPSAYSRPSWKNRGPMYTEYGVSLRSVSAEQSQTNLVLHYLSNGTATLCMFHNKEMFFIPVIIMLKALLDITDQFTYTELIKGKEDDSFYKGCIAAMMRQAQEENLSTQREILQYIGSLFRTKINAPEWYTDSQVAERLLKTCVCTHLDNNTDKFNLLVFMTRKLFTYAGGGCAAESPDNPMFQEVLLPGHLYQAFIQEKMTEWLHLVRNHIVAKAKKTGAIFSLDHGVMNKAIVYAHNITKKMEYLLASGNLGANSKLGMMQSTGLAVLADKLNFMRYISHFRCIHRGGFFTEMRTTTVRKLLGEAWGFLCPVHTPDGPPCGLMNHMSANCHVVNTTFETSHIEGLLCGLGMTAYEDSPPCPYKQCYPVLLDGTVIGWVAMVSAPQLVEELRMMKVKGLENIPRMMEICLVKQTPVASQYPGITLCTNLARMMRPVKNLAYDAVEMIGTFEQPYMNICIIPEEAHEGVTTHQELSEFGILSAVASLTPFSDYNQSPRNMYQCQMGKQTMGFPQHNWQGRSDIKSYRLQTPQSPLVRPFMYDNYNIDEYPLGTNAIVAVISYTGYDMEDAMILSKSSYERGFCHGSVYKAEFIDLKALARQKGVPTMIFGCPHTEDYVTKNKLDIDGLPPVGTLLSAGSPFYSFIDLQTNKLRVIKYNHLEPARVDHIKILGHDSGTHHMWHVCIMLRIERNPIIGDKFSSRHGQKGICSQKWPVENMPFSESGMTPDILFNPHGFPSRMTIGMMIESMAGKSAVSHGLVHDATPFTFSEDDPPIDYFGKLMVKAGYNYYGTERMYSGVDGTEFEADIFMGVVYYQRLRHMVSDKFQVRTTGRVDMLTRQPVQGRRRGGGVRFGEMERDALLAHGTSFLLNDRLLNCSDECKAFVCVQCGSVLSPVMMKPAAMMAAASREAQRTWTCQTCDNKQQLKVVRMPYVFRYLLAELASVGIRVKMDLKPMSAPLH